MRKSDFLCAAVLALTVIATADAQCNRGGGGGGSATGTFSPSTTSTGFNSPSASLNSINTSPNATFLATQARSQLAQYQYMLAQQQRNMQMMAQRQQMLERQIQALRDGDSTSAADQFASGRVDTRRERLRRQNAEKAFDLARRAEARGRTSTAQSNYRRVVRIAGDDSELGRRASNALASLTGGELSEKTMLVSTNLR